MTRAEENFALKIDVPDAEIVVFEKDGEEHARAIPNITEKGRDLWRLFSELSGLRNENGRMSPGDIADWLRLHGRRISTLEAGVIDKMDRQFAATLKQEIALNQARST